MAAIARSTPNFALPATQNTAPVHEYRCLYTHDLRKKAKKWHDGSARFHTFNKRVMVYDDTKNYIGDLHYRDDEDFGEGIELQLDRGVLVEVGERVGETHTDLTGIVSKPNTTANLPNACDNTGARPVQRINHFISQGRPKSLTEVLGTSQGRPGRAKLPVTSPYEQRHTVREAQDIGPPLKKHKISHGKENVYPVHVTPQLPLSPKDYTPSSQMTVSPTLPRSRNPNQKAVQHAIRQDSVVNVVIDISSEDEVQERHNTLTEKTQPSKKASNELPKQKSLPEVASSHMGSKPTTPKRSRQRPEAAKAAGKLSTEVARPSPASIACGNSDGSRTSSKLATASLKMKSQEPRRKLLYRALLPPIAATEKPFELSSMNSAMNENSRSFQEQSHDEVTPAQEGIEDDYTADPPGLEPLTFVDEASVSYRNTQQTPQKPTPAPVVTQTSPLFVSQSASQQQPSPTQFTVEDDFMIPMTQEVLGRHEEPPSAVMHDNVDASSVDDYDPEPESPCFPPPPALSKLPAQGPLVSMPPPKITIIQTPVSNSPYSDQPTASPAKTRPFIRSLSANDSPLPCDPRTSPAHRPIQPVHDSPIVHRSLFSPRQHPPLALTAHVADTSPIKSPFQRSRSDTAAIIPTTIAPLVPSNPADEEQGPWTTLEAFLLFDRWPMCKQKNKPTFQPLSTMDYNAFDDDMDGDDDNDKDGIGFAPALAAASKSHPVLIRSAKSLWRDG